MQDIERKVVEELRVGLASIRGYLDQVKTQNIFRELLFIKLLSNQIKLKNNYFNSRITRGLNFKKYIENPKCFFEELKLLLNENVELKDLIVEVNEVNEKQGYEVIEKIFLAFNKMDEVDKVKPEIVFKCFLDLIASENPMSIPSEPSNVRTLIDKLLKEKNIETIYDPAIGTGMLITEIAKSHENSSVYGQDMHSEMVRICKMLLILDERIDDVVNIKEGNTLINPKNVNNEKLETFDCVISNPPMKSMNCGFEEIKEDKFNRFHRGLPSKSIGDYGFITQVVESLNEKGIGIVIEAAGVLFRGSKEGVIRKALIEENIIEAVIALPSNMLYGTGIKINLLIFNKNKNEEKIFFIDVSKMIEGNKRLTIIENEIIEKVAKIYKEKIEIEGISRNVPKKEVEENNFNLSVQKYIRVKVQEEEEDINEINNEMKKLEKELIEIQKRLNKYFD
ncbi:MAG: N-6 DNA methylase [Clostridium sp.]